MQNSNSITAERARRLLREIAELSQEASMTGMLENGVGRVIARYNALLAQCESGGLLPQGLFSQLPENASYGEIGVEARLAMASLEETNGGGAKGKMRGIDFGAIVRIAPFVGSRELGDLVREQIRSGIIIGMDALTAVAPFLDQETMSMLIREHLHAPEPPEPPTAPTAPEPPQPPSTSEPEPIAIPARSHLPEVAPNEELQRLAARLTDSGLTPEERTHIAIRLSELALQQGQIAQEG